MSRAVIAAIFANNLCAEAPSPTRADIESRHIQWCYRQADLLLAQDDSDKAAQVQEDDDWDVLLPNVNIPIQVNVVSITPTTIEITDSNVLNGIFTGNKTYPLSSITLVRKR